MRTVDADEFNEQSYIHAGPTNTSELPTGRLSTKQGIQSVTVLTPHLHSTLSPNTDQESSDISPFANSDPTPPESAPARAHLRSDTAHN